MQNFYTEYDSHNKMLLDIRIIPDNQCIYGANYFQVKFSTLHKIA